MRDPRLRQILSALGHAIVLLAVPCSLGADCFVISGGLVADGSGGPLRKADVRVCGDEIRAVGQLRPAKGERVVDARGLVVAPGFIDIHNHSTDGLADEPLAASQTSQGITTLVVGADGESPLPVAAYLRERRAAPAAVNVMALVGHATVRHSIMGEDYKRAARPDEVARMAELVDQEMRSGAAGLSSGLEYEVGSWSTTDELVALARAAGKHGGFYMTHTRDEADKSMEAFAEAIAIAEGGSVPLQISHIKLGTVAVWGKTKEVFGLIEAARRRGVDVTADCYPYEAWHANIEVLVPNKKYDDPESVARALSDVGGADKVSISRCRAHPDWESRTLAEVSNAEGLTPVALFSRIVQDGSAHVICHSMREADVLAFYGRPWVMVASDGGIGSRHPRGTGTFPRVLGRFVREKKALSLAEAVRKMTSMPARRLQLADRGSIRAAARADLVLFDPAIVVDRATFSDPTALSEGIRLVIVNGEAVWQDGKPTGKTPGRVLARESGAPAASSPPRGSLLIVGGGPLPDEVLHRFVELAGGPGKARIVLFPMASSDKDASLELAEDFRNLGAEARRMVLSRAQAEKAPADLLAGVTGIWFGGGDQVLLTAALRGTPVEAAIHDRYRQGAVVGGTSAGAAVMTTPMLTGDERQVGGDRPPRDKDSPLSAYMTIARDNVVTEDGFGLLPGVIIDQHFVRRRRSNRLLSLVLEHPDLIGVGIDESTALEVDPDGSWRVLGASAAVVFDARAARITPAGSCVLGAADVRLHVLPAGSRFDPNAGLAGLP